MRMKDINKWPCYYGIHILVEVKQYKYTWSFTAVTRTLMELMRTESTGGECASRISVDEWHLNCTPLKKKLYCRAVHIWQIELKAYLLLKDEYICSRTLEWNFSCVTLKKSGEVNYVPVQEHTMSIWTDLSCWPRSYLYKLPGAVSIPHTLQFSIALKRP